jgi:hypothetical protein
VLSSLDGDRDRREEPGLVPPNRRRQCSRTRPSPQPWPTSIAAT